MRNGQLIGVAMVRYDKPAAAWDRHEHVSTLIKRLGTPRPTGAVKRMRGPHGECDAFAASVLPIIRELQAAHHMSRDVVLRTTAPANPTTSISFPASS
jgi:hypothetical protein